MAESYRGLTIRIGGDTTKLTQSLKSANGAISGVSQELRKLGTALRLDPTSINAYNAQLGYMGQQASNTAMKLAELQRAQEQIAKEEITVKVGTDASGESIVRTGTIEELSKATEEAHAWASQARVEYNALTDTLAKMHTEVSSLADEVAREEGAKFAEQFDVTGELPSIEAMKDAIEEVRNLGYVEIDEKSVEKLFNAIDDLANGVTKDTTAAREHLVKLMEAASNFKGIRYTDANQNTDEVLDVWDELARRLQLNIGYVQEFKSKYSETQDAFRASSTNLVNANQVAGMADLNVEVIKTEASIKSLSKAIANMEKPTEVMLKMAELTENVKHLDDAFKATMSSMGSMGDIIEADPKNMDALVQAMHLAGEAEREVAEEAERVRQQIAGFDADEVESFTDHTKSAQQQLFETATAAQKAREAYDLQNGALKQAEDELARLESRWRGNAEAARENQRALDDKRDAQKADNEAITDAQKRIAELIPKVDSLREKMNQTASAENGAKMRVEFEGLQEKLVQVEARYKSVSDTVRSMAATFASSVQSMSLEDAFGKGTDKMVSQLTSGFDAAVKRVEVFNKAVVASGSSEDAVAKRADAMTDAIRAGASAIDQFRKGIEGIDSARIEAVRAEFGSSSNAIAQTTASVNELFTKLTEAKRKFEELVSENGLGDLGKDFLDINVQNGGLDLSEYERLPEVVRQAREEAMQFATQLALAVSKLGDATVLQQVEAYESSIAGITTRLAEMQAKSTVFTDIEKSMKAIKDAGFRDTGVDEFLREMDLASESTKGAKERYEELKKAFKDTGDENTLSKTLSAATAYATALEHELQNAKQVLADFDMSKVNLDAITSGDVEGKVKQAEDEFNELKRRAEEFNKEIAQTNAQIAAMGSGADTSELDAKVESLQAELNEVEEQAKGAETALEEALNTKKYADTQAAIGGIAGELNNVKNAMGSGFKDTFSDIEKSMKALTDVGFRNTGVDEFLKSMNQTGESVKGARERYEELKKALNDKTWVRDQETFSKTLDAASSYAAALRKQLDEAKQALAGFDMSKIDMSVISSGDVEGNVKRITDEFGELKRMEEELTKQANALRAALAAVDDDADTSELTSKLGAVESELADVRSSAAKTGDALETALNTQQYVNAQGLVANLSSELDKVSKEVKGGFREAFDIDEAALQQVVDRIGDVVRRAGSEIVESSNAIDAAYRDMRKTVQGTESQFEQLHDAAVRFSQTHIVTADTMLEMEALGGQLGVAAKNLQEFGETASNLDIATDLDAEDIALKMGQLTNVMSDLDETKFDNFADALVRLGNNTATTESAIMNVAQRMSSVANVTSMTTPQLLAWSAAIASTGQRSEAAATAVNNTITGIGKAVSMGGETLEQFANIANMSSDEFVKAWGESSSNALEAFVKGLAGLSDDSTDAIEALDAVGISSVRQETALLGLSQTIQNLDNAITMSDDAFHGIADQWGQAGDAAREAERKSEGFSGTLAILQNNATALGASLGDGLIPLMKALASALQTVTDFMDSLPEPMKQAVVETGAFAVALSAVLMALRGLGFKDIVPNLLEWVAGIGSATTATEGMTAATEGASVATKGLGIAMDALPVLAIVAAFTEIVKVISEFVDVASIAGDTTGKLNEAMGGLNDLTNDLAGSGDVTKLFSDVAESAHEGLEAVNRFASETKESMTVVAQNSAVVREYGDDIRELAERWREIDGDGADKEAAFARVSEAVGRFNDETGAAIDVTQLLNGEYGSLSTVIDEVTDAYERQSQAKAYNELYEDAVKQEIELNEKLREAQEEQASATIATGKAFADLTKGTFDYNDAIALLTPGVTSLRDAKDMLKSSMEVDELGKEAERVGELKDRYKELLDGVSGATGPFSSFEVAMTSAGYKVSELAELNGEQRRKLLDVENELRSAGHTLGEWRNLNVSALAQVASAWDGNVQNIIAKIKELDSTPTRSFEGGETSKEEQTALKRQQEDEYNAAKQHYDDMYNELKDSLDAEYNAKKKAYDNEYNLEKKRLDAEYNEKKKAYDKAYNARKKALDKEYNALKDKLDDDADALKDANDAELQAMKERHKAEQAELKKQLDKQYKERKKYYNNIQKQYKKANDKILKDLKKQQQAEIKEFKKATDARIAEIKREYEERKRLLEQQDGTVEIDNRIQSLKDQTAAEQAEIKRREQEEKKADLQRAVDQAKSRRKRAEAEKALNDYLAELAQEAREAEREAEIERLEQQKDDISVITDARKDALDEERDAVIEAYKEQREIELEALQERMDAQYEALKEKLDAELEVRKEKLDEQLATYKESLDSELEALKAKHKAEEDELKRLLDGKLQALKDNNDARLEQAKEANDAELAALKESQQAQLDAVKESNSARLESMKEGQQAELEAIKASNQAQLEQTKRDYDAQLQALKRSQEDELNAAKDGGARMVESAKETGSALARATDDARNGIKQGLGTFLRETEKSFSNTADEVLKSGEETGRGYPTNIIEGFRRLAGAVDQEFGRMMFPVRDEKNHTEKYGIDMIKGVAGGIGGMAAGHAMDTALDGVMRAISNALGHSEWTESSGYDMIQNFVSGIYRGDGILTGALSWVADLARSFLGHSVAKRGPLHEGGRGEAVWGEHMVQNFAGGIRSALPELESQLERMAALVADGAHDDSLSFRNPVDELIESMRLDESALASQVERMSRIVSDGFDPDMSVDAAFEAMATIRRSDSGGDGLAEAVRELARASAPSETNINLSMDLSGVVVRGDDDIREIARTVTKMMAAEMRRSSAASLGR